MEIGSGHNLRITHMPETEALGSPERRGRSRRRWRWALGILAGSVLLVQIFLPGLLWILFFGPHKNPITTTHFEVSIPSDWDLLRTGDSLSAIKRKRCLTRFCTPSPDDVALVTISWSGTFSQADRETVERGWENMKAAMLRNLQNGGSNADTRNLSGGALGNVQCVEGEGPTPASAVKRFCFAREAALFIGFQGNPRHLPAFGRIINSIKAR
jgi:hypothetical protein